MIPIVRIGWIRYHDDDIFSTVAPADVDYRALAERAKEGGDLLRAQQLFEKVWDFQAAAECARARGDRPEVLRLLLEARAYPQAAELAAALGPGKDELARAAKILEDRRMWAQAAVVRERIGEFLVAAALYERA